MKRSRLKLSRKIKEPPDLIQQTMDYDEAAKKDTWKGERNAADAILRHCRLHKLPMKLDRLTLGVGNCFMVAALQQLKTPEVHQNLNDELKQMAIDLDHMKLRRQVVDFIQKNEDREQVKYMKEIFVPDPAVVDGPKTWEEYWEKMLIDCTWASGDFVQATAWFLKHNIWIIDTSCIEGNPFLTIHGHMNDEGSLPANVEPLLIGSSTGRHFQSLLFDWEKVNGQNLGCYHNKVRQHLMQVFQGNDELDEPPCKIQKEDFKMSSLSESRCPNCKKEFKQLLQHINKSKCHSAIKPEIIQQLTSLSVERTRLKKKIKIAENRNRKRMDDPEEYKRQENKTKAKFRERKRLEDLEEFQSKENKTKAEFRERKRLEDLEEFKRLENKTKAEFREKKRLENHEEMKMQQKEWNKTFRKVENEEHRLKAFRQSIMYGPIFICISCHMKLFRNAVVEFTNITMKEIDEEIPIKDCIIDINHESDYRAANCKSKVRM